MASPKRWFPVSHDLNSDSEVWDLTNQFGDRALRVWLEILSILDRNENEFWLAGGWLANLSRRVRQTPATVSRVIRQCLANGWLTAGEELANGWPTVLRGTNYSKYHRTREPNKTPTRSLDRRSPNLSEPSEPSEPLKIKKDSRRLNPIMQKFIDDWNEDFVGKLPTVKLPLSESRKRKLQLRLEEHPKEEFWISVFTNIWHSKFLMGNGDQGWKCTLDFLIANDTNCIKIAEGVYGENQERKGN